MVRCQAQRSLEEVTVILDQLIDKARKERSAKP